MKAYLDRGKALGQKLRQLPLYQRLLLAPFISVIALVGVAVGVMMLGILLPIGLSAWEAYTPTDATLVVIWPIGAVLIVLGIVLGFFREQG